MKKIRLDILLTERGLAETRTQAQRLIMAGQVRVDGQMVVKASHSVPDNAAIEVEGPPQFVSRGGEKLEGAFRSFNLDVQGKICSDVGASTGGFTDCLLQHNAAKVYAIDVGYGILHWKLRNDGRVVIMERTNARFVKTLPEMIDLATVDASFISLKILLPVIRGWFGEKGGQVIALIKPQFVAGRAEVSRGDGVITDPEIHRQVLLDVLTYAQSEGYCILGLARSPLRGPKGNVEFLANLKYPGDMIEELGSIIDGVLIEN